MPPRKWIVKPLHHCLRYGRESTSAGYINDMTTHSAALPPLAPFDNGQVLASTQICCLNRLAHACIHTYQLIHHLSLHNFISKMINNNNNPNQFRTIVSDVALQRKSQWKYYATSTCVCNAAEWLWVARSVRVCYASRENRKHCGCVFNPVVNWKLLSMRWRWFLKCANEFPTRRPYFHPNQSIYI